MLLKTVTYRKLVSSPGFSNEAVEATAFVGLELDPNKVLAELKLWVNAQLEGSQELKSLNSQIHEKRFELDNLEVQCVRARQQLDETAGIMKMFVSEADRVRELEKLPF